VSDSSFNPPNPAATESTAARTEPPTAWWLLLLRGMLAIVFGAMALLWPTITALALAIIFGAYALVDGVSMLVDAVREYTGKARAWSIVGGVAGILAGIVAFIWPGITAAALAAIIGAWAVVTGVVEIVAAIRLRREIRGEWLLAVTGVISVIAGGLILLAPGIGAISIAMVIGAYALFAGALMVTFAVRQRLAGRRRGSHSTTGHRPATA
jgi:uncharacterized membrane protein HdeD (DUF308 family)